MALISALTRYEVPPSPMGRYTLNHTMAKNHIRSERKKEKKKVFAKESKNREISFFFSWRAEKMGKWSIMANT